jgi:putative DNA primase/helicase
MNIFLDNAPRHWAAGLPVLPLMPREKRVLLNAWSTYCVTMPSLELQQVWLRDHPDGNMGLPLGPQSKLLAIDIDTEDPRVLKVVDEVCGYSPWVRRGKKGSVRVYRYSGERTFRIKDVNNNTILECLSQGAQVVLPPSIHPDTQMPYTATCDLVEVKDQVRTLPEGVEVLLRQALIDAGFELATQGYTKVAAWVPAGSRDTQMTSVAGILSRAVIRGERTLVEAMDEMATWVENYTEKVAGDPLDPDKAREKVLSFFVRDCTGPKRSPVRPGWDEGLPEKTVLEIKELLGEEGEAWDFSRFQANYTSLVESHKAGSSAFLTGVGEIVTKMVNCSAMSQLEEQSMIRYMVNLSQRTLTTVMIRDQLRELRSGDLEGVDHSELGGALITELEKLGKVAHHAESWWRWNGAYWVQMDDTTVLRTVAETFGHYPAAKRHSDHKGIMQTAAAMTKRDLTTRPLEGINFANGFLTSDLKLLAHDDSFGKTYVLPYRYIPGSAGAMPRFMQYLWDCWGGMDDFDQRVELVRETMAATIFGIGWKFQRAVCCFGVAGTGKSVLLDIMQGLVPSEAVCSIRPADWDDTYLPAKMYGKLMNRAGELSETKLIPGDMFKLVVEGSEISAQEKFKQVFAFRPRCTHWFGSNHLPKTRDSSGGFTRRWVFHHFTRTVKNGMKNTNLAQEILDEEREAIAAWAAGAIPALMSRHDYIACPASDHLTHTMAVSNNSVRQFMVQNSTIRRTGKPEARLAESELYDVYYSFCIATTNAKPVNLANFRHRMEELKGEFGYEIDTQLTDFGFEETHYLGFERVKKG